MYLLGQLEMLRQGKEKAILEENVTSEDQELAAAEGEDN